MPASFVLHATSVVFCGRGLLIRGPSGAGKSDLALRLMDAGGLLIADDHTALVLEKDRLVASAPATIRGMMEVRGVGLLKVPFCAKAAISAVVDLVHDTPVERLPDTTQTELEEAAFKGVKLAYIKLNPFEASAVAKLRAFLQYKSVES